MCERPTAGPAILWSHPSGDWLSFGASPFMTPLPEPRAESGATRYLTRLGSECEFVIRTYVIFPGYFTRPTGVLDLQLSRRIDHVETWSPPYVRAHPLYRRFEKTDPLPVANTQAGTT